MPLPSTDAASLNEAYCRRTNPTPMRRSVAAGRVLQQRHVGHGGGQRLLDERVQPGGHRLDADAGVQMVRHGHERDVRVRGEIGDGARPDRHVELIGQAARRGPRRYSSAP